MTEIAHSVTALLFDKDGTLFDFSGTWNVWAHNLIRDLARGDGYTQKALADALDFDVAERRFRPSSFVIAGTNREVAEVVARTLELSDVAAVEADLSRRAVAAPLQPAVPLAPLLDRLTASGYALGVMTNDTEAAARAHLDAFDISDRFAFICGSDTGHGAKPDPGPLLAFCRHVGIDPLHTAMVGDSTHDLEAAQAAGMIGVGVLTGMATAAELYAYAEIVLNDIGELPDWLGLNDV